MGSRARIARFPMILTEDRRLNARDYPPFLMMTRSLKFGGTKPKTRP